MKTVTVHAELTVELEDDAAELVASLVKHHGLSLFKDDNGPWSFYDYNPTTKVGDVFLDGDPAR